MDWRRGRACARQEVNRVGLLLSALHGSSAGVLPGAQLVDQEEIGAVELIHTVEEAACAGVGHPSPLVFGVFIRRETFNGLHKSQGV